MTLTGDDKPGDEPEPTTRELFLTLPFSDVGWTTTRRTLGSLVPWEKNPRRLTEKQATDLAGSLRKFGLPEPLVINLDGNLIGGHQRRNVLSALLSVAPDVEIDVRIPSRLLTFDEAEELAIRLNKNTGEWDWDLLANEFEQARLEEWGFEARDFQQDPTFAPPVEPSPAPPTERKVASEAVIEVYCTKADVEAFKPVLDEWGKRESVTINVAT